MAVKQQQQQQQRLEEPSFCVSEHLFAHCLPACLCLPAPACLPLPACPCLPAPTHPLPACCSPELLSTSAQGVVECIIYRDPGIHPGDVRRVRCGGRELEGRSVELGDSSGLRSQWEPPPVRAPVHKVWGCMKQPPL